MAARRKMGNDVRNVPIAVKVKAQHCVNELVLFTVIRKTLVFFS